MGLSITVLPTLQILPTFEKYVYFYIYEFYVQVFLFFELKDKVGNTVFLRKGM